MLISVLGGIFSPSVVRAGPLDAVVEATTGSFINDAMINLADKWLSLMARGLYLSGALLDASIDFSLNKLKEYTKGSVSKAWAAGRDIANIFFIFILLYIAIATILQIEGFGTKSLLVRVVLVALLVNFSLVITQVVIDASNVLAVALFENIKGGNSDVSIAFMRGLRLESLYDIGKKGTDVAFSFTPAQMLTVMVFGSLFILVASFVFLAAAVLFVTRSVVLIFLMILSPLAFLAWVLPGTSGYAQKWWETLLHQSFFAPAYLFVITAVLLVLQGNAQGGVEAVTKGKVLDTSGNTFVGALISSNKDSFGIILNFAILIGMILAALIVAKSMGAYGAETVIKWGHNARKWGQGAVGRNTVGRLASIMAESGAMKGIAAKAPRLGSLMYGTLDAASGYGFGGAAGGYRGAVEREAKRRVAIGKRIAGGEGGKERLQAYKENLEKKPLISRVASGAIAGTMFAPGVGTVVGGAVAGLGAMMPRREGEKMAVKKLNEYQAMEDKLSRRMEQDMTTLQASAGLSPGDLQGLDKDKQIEKLGSAVEATIDKLNKELQNLSLQLQTSGPTETLNKQIQATKQGIRDIRNTQRDIENSRDKLNTAQNWREKKEEKKEATSKEK